MIRGTNHCTITAQDRAATLDDDCGLPGLVKGPRPDLGFAGAGTWPLWSFDPNGASMEPGFGASAQP